MSAADPDRLYNLLPAVYRLRDAEAGEPLRALLRVITEQVTVVQDDVTGLYDNWFIETCQDWAAAYIADLIGYRPIDGSGQTGGNPGTDSAARIAAEYPRRDVANAIHNRRRKGTLALLESLAVDAAGWPAHAVEFYRLLAVYQSINWRQLRRGHTVDLRDGDALRRLDGPFDRAAHTVGVGRLSSSRTRSPYNVPDVGLFVWRLKPYSVTQAPAFALDRMANRLTFSVLGNSTPLMTLPQPEAPDDHLPGETGVPAWITRRAFAARTADYYGPERSLCIWRDRLDIPIPLRNIVAADLTDWFYHPQGDQVAVDPELGRIVLGLRSLPRDALWVTYHYGFSADLGGGEYPRRLTPTTAYLPDDGKPADRPASPAQGHRLYRVGRQESLRTINAALDRWWRHKPARAIIEITDNEAYVEQIDILLDLGQELEVRGADGRRPTVRLLDWHTSRGDALRIARALVPAEAAPPAPAPTTAVDCGPPPETRPPRLVLDGLLVTGRGLQIMDELFEVTIRHCTLVPGWSLRDNCDPEHAEEPSIEIDDSSTRLTIDHSIIGTIRVIENEVETDPIAIAIRDSIVDSAHRDYEAIVGPDGRHAHAILTIQRSTVLGRIAIHAIALGENSIFTGIIRVARRQLGCLRFSSLPLDSRTPRRFQCQPDLVRASVLAQHAATQIDAEERDRLLTAETLRVRPQFISVRYGTPTYCQFTASCAPEITSGAEDEAAMGAFHDLFEPQRTANLQARLAEYTPAGDDAGMLFVT